MFSAGCGRVFEGTTEQMLTSLHKIAALHDDTLIYCAHEYTADNLAFAQSIEPNNDAIKHHINTIKKKPCSLPSYLGLERRINPFLRLDTIAKQKQWTSHSTLQIFETLRAQKNNW